MARARHAARREPRPRGACRAAGSGAGAAAAVGVEGHGGDDEDVVREAVLALYDVRRDEAELRKIPTDATRGEYFSSLRRNYWRRRAFHNSTVELTGGSPELRGALAGLGFRV